MEARSQLRHRPTWCGGQLLSFNSRLASSPRQTRLAWSMSNRIWLAKHKRTQSEPHVELADYSRSVTFLFHLHRWVCGCACAGLSGEARRSRLAAAGRVCIGERTEQHRGAIEADGTKHAIRSRKDPHREMENGRCDQATNAGERGVHPAQLAVGAAGNDHATEQRAGRLRAEFQTLRQPRCAGCRVRFGGGSGGSVWIER